MPATPSRSSPLPPPPRRVRRRTGPLAAAGLWGTRLFILPHQLVGVAAVLALLFLLLAQLLGTDVPGHVTSAHESRSTKGGPTYTIHYQYTTSNHTYTGSDPVSLGQYTALRPDPPPPTRANAPTASTRPNRRRAIRHAATPTTRMPTPAKAPGTSDPLDISRFTFQPTPSPTPKSITLHHFALGPFHYAKLTPSKDSTWAVIGFLTLWSAFWNGVVSIFTYQLWIKPLRQRRLLKHGLSTPGTLTAKKATIGNKTTTYTVSYTFQDPATRRPIAARCPCSTHHLYDAVAAGQPVIIVYDPLNPDRSLVYECADYEALPDAPLLMPL